MKKKEGIAQQIELALDKRLKGIVTFNDNASFIGYNPLEKIRGSLYNWVEVPFNGVGVFCQLRCPSALQLQQCGDVTNIVAEKQKSGEDFTLDEIADIRNFQENLCKLVFNIPTYDNIATLVGNFDFVVSDKKKQLEELTKRYEENKASMTEVQKQILDKQIETIELQLAYILPDDTMSFIAYWAMGNDISDIKKITHENFLRAASLARAHNKAPSDYIQGRFTDFNKQEIDAHAIAVLEKHLADQRIANSGKFRWLLGSRNKRG